MLEVSDNVNSLGDVNMRKHHANTLKPINKDSIGKGRKSLSSEEIKMINNIIGSTNIDKIRKMIER